MAEVYPCGVCQRPVGDNDKAVGCDGECDTWFHIECVQLSLTAYEHLIAEEQVNTQNHSRRIRLCFLPCACACSLSLSLCVYFISLPPISHAACATPSPFVLLSPHSDETTLPILIIIRRII